MAEYQLSHCNLAAALIPWNEGVGKIPGLGLGSLEVDNDETDISNGIRLFKTQTGETTKIARCLLVVQLGSGAMTVEVKLTANAGVTDFASPDATTGAISNTTEVNKWFEVTAEKPVITLRRIGGVAGAEIAQAGLYIFRKPADGKLLGGHEPSVGFIGLGGLEGGFNTLLEA